jgi:hypothetical protein
MQLLDVAATRTVVPVRSHRIVQGPTVPAESPGVFDFFLFDLITMQSCRKCFLHVLTERGNKLHWSLVPFGPHSETIFIFAQPVFIRCLNSSANNVGSMPWYLCIDISIFEVHMSAIHELVTSSFFICTAHVAKHLFVLRRFFFEGFRKWNLAVVPWLLQITLVHDHEVTNFSSEGVF